LTATAHKLARIVYHLLPTGQTYDETVFAQQEAQNNSATRTASATKPENSVWWRRQIPMEVS
jgi:hypothetical protein